MKHISESIIGKRGSLSKVVPELQTHDIVRLANDHYYIVITDEDEMKQSKLDFPAMAGKGIFLRYESISRSWSWQPISEYEKNLRIKPQYKSITSLDVMAVYRSVMQTHTVYRTNFEHCCDEDQLTKIIRPGYTDYKLIWER